MTPRSRVIAVLIAIPLGALLWFLRANIEMRDRMVPTPLGEQARQNPYFAAERLARGLGARAEWRRVLGDLPPGVDVIVLGEWHWSLIESRRRMLENWVEAGGRLVVTAAMRDGGEFAEWIGVRGVDPEPEEKKTATDEPAAEPASPAASPAAGLVDDDRCVLMAGDGRVPLRRSPGESWNICGFHEHAALESDRKPDWSLADDDGLQVVSLRKGKGRVTVLNLAPFTYRQLLDGQNGQLLVAAMQLQPKDSVLFLSVNEATPLLTLMWRHGSAILLLLLAAVALMLWRGGSRFGPVLPAASASRRSLAEQITGTGRFIGRNGGASSLHAAQRASVERLAERRVAGFRQLTDEGRIHAVARETGVEYRRVAAAMAWTDDARQTDLAGALLCLEACRRILAGAARRR